MMPKIVDKRFVGTWKGTDNGRFYENEIISWIVYRYDDGTMYIKFTTINQLNGSKSYLEEFGEWWIEDDLYHEIRESEDQMDIYVFSFLSKDSIHFIDTQEDYPDPYNFVDYRIFLD